MHANLHFTWLLLRRIGQLTLAALAHYRRIQAGQLAGSLSFMSILALVPILTVVLAVFSAYPDLSRVSVVFRHYIETELLPETGSKMIVNYLFNFSQSAGKLGGASIIFLSITALLLLNRIEGALNQIWGITTPRKFGERVINYWVVLTMGPIALGGVFYIMLQSLSYSMGWFGMVPTWLQGGITKTISFALLTSLFSFGYVSLPNRKVSWSHGIFAAVLATLAISILQNLFELYLRLFPSFALIYGAFATLPIFLVWVYLCWQTFLLGACMVVRLAEETSAEGSAHANAPATSDLLRQSEQAVLLLAQLWQTFQRHAHVHGTTPSADVPKAKPSMKQRLRGLQHACIGMVHQKKRPQHQLQQLAQHTHLPPEHCRALLEKLQQAGWVHRLASEHGDQWLLTRHPASIRQEDLQQVLLAKAHEYMGMESSAWLQHLLHADNLLALWKTLGIEK